MKLRHESSEAVSHEWQSHEKVSLQRSLQRSHFHPGNHRNTISQLNFTGSLIFDSSLLNHHSITCSAKDNTISNADSLSLRKLIFSKDTHLIPCDLVLEICSSMMLVSRQITRMHSCCLCSCHHVRLKYQTFAVSSQENGE